MRPLFSIVVPVYKVEAYIHKCMESLLNQTYSDFEIILVDDGSPDSCPGICDVYAKQSDKVRVIHKKNGGLSEARNYGIDAAEGDYIVLVDSDDYIENNMLELLFAYTKDLPDVIAIDATVEGSEHPNKFDVCHSNYAEKQYSSFEYLIKGAPVAAWLHVCRREFLNKNEMRFKCGILHEDNEFTPRMILKASTIIVTRLSLYHYVIRENSITQKKDKRKNVSDVYDTGIEIINIFERVEDEKLRNVIENQMVDAYLSKYGEAKAYKYGKEYYHPEYVRKYAHALKTRQKGRLFAVSPLLYCMINSFVKRIKG